MWKACEGAGRSAKSDRVRLQTSSLGSREPWSVVSQDLGEGDQQGATTQEGELGMPVSVRESVLSECMF